MKAIRNQADRITTLSESGLTGLPRIIAEKKIKAVGYYDYTDAETNEKVFIES